ncbi:hypothetical protein IW261DRAFT_83252 [Armillaria novae-zelandiae]|uniref:Uncharacterized protein n=1 Tax=Armillaria novae-zelandiae TaxID=153914 RepID=A0AA39PWA8_9AGAR|nr:hypothetical protein IW261DRAFT_83252 [Armillaria novae-zelandiae]
MCVRAVDWNRLGFLSTCLCDTTNGLTVVSSCRQHYDIGAFGRLSKSSVWTLICQRLPIVGRLCFLRQQIPNCARSRSKQASSLKNLNLGGRNTLTVRLRHLRYKTFGTAVFSHE